MSRWSWGGAVVALVLAGCAPESEQDRCDDQAAWLEGVSRSLPRECEVDSDCRVIFVRPDQPVATSGRPNDAALARTLETYEGMCGEIARGTGEARAVCQLILADHTLDDGTEVEVERGRLCTIAGSFEPPPSEGSEEPVVPGEPDVCMCERDADCASGTRCGGCACWPVSPCGDACRQAATCGALDALGVGTSPASCPASCEAAVARNPQAYEAFASCVAQTDCNQITSCARLLP